MNAKGIVHKYGDNVDTDVIIPARYLNIADRKELAAHCMEDIDTEFVKVVNDGDVMVGGFNFGCGSSREHAPITLQADFLPAEPQGKPKNTGLGNLSLLQRIFLTQELNQGLLHCRRILYQLSYEGSPFSLVAVPIYKPNYINGQMVQIENQ